MAYLPSAAHIYTTFQTPAQPAPDPIAPPTHQTVVPTTLAPLTLVRQHITAMDRRALSLPFKMLSLL
jgi:hypothetical protein